MRKRAHVWQSHRLAKHNLDKLRPRGGYAHPRSRPKSTRCRSRRSSPRRPPWSERPRPRRRVQVARWTQPAQRSTADYFVPGVLASAPLRSHRTLQLCSTTSSPADTELSEVRQLLLRFSCQSGGVPNNAGLVANSWPGRPAPRGAGWSTLREHALIPGSPSHPCDSRCRKQCSQCQRGGRDSARGGLLLGVCRRLRAQSRARHRHHPAPQRLCRQMRHVRPQLRPVLLWVAVLVRSQPASQPAIMWLAGWQQAGWLAARGPIRRCYNRKCSTCTF